MSKRYKSLFTEKNKKAIVDIDEVIKMVKKNCNTKFNESIDVSINLNLKQKKEEFNIRTVVNLPHGNGKSNKVAVLCEETKIKEGLSMYTTLDKTVILKGVDLFSGLSSEKVFEIAQIVNEECYLMDEIIFNEGGMGDSMFIIISGSVSVFNLQKEITTLGEGECFGEMALLDRESRSSSIKALNDTTVLKIEEVGFYELAAGNIEIIQGIVKILSTRLREANVG